MMFLQFFTWGAWFVTLSQCLSANELGAIEGGTYGTAPIAAMIAPLFLGLIADRFFASHLMLAVLMLVGGGCLYGGYNATVQGDADTAYWFFLGHMLCYMPTLGLTNTIAFTNIRDQQEFPKIRVWGTIGWIIAGLVVGFLGWSEDLSIFWLAAMSSIALGLFAFSLPPTPPPAKGQPIDLRTIFMVDALKMLKDFPFAIFMLCSCLICIPLAYYYGLTSKYLPQLGFDQPASTMTLGQMSEIFFMVLIPFFFRKLGVKWMILIGMGAWVARYLLFAFGAPLQAVWMLFAGILLHGVCYDFFFVTGFMYTDKKAPPEIRGQAQSMLVFFTQGVGMYFGYWVAFARQGATVTNLDTLKGAVDNLKPEADISFSQQLGRMFSVNLPEGLDPQLFADTMAQWKEFWLLPAYMAAAILVAFFLLFWDRVDVEDTGSDAPTDQATTDEPQ